jgi:hypothetical protein
MDTASGPSRIARVDWRHRPRVDSVTQTTPEQETEEIEEEEHYRSAIADETLLAREQRGRTVMSKGHRQFHRRAAPDASGVLTVNVNVEQTIDTAGLIVGVQTVTPDLPVVPAYPTAAVPTVPTVPPFPSDLNVPTVPAYPYASSLPATPVPATPSAPTPSVAPAPTVPPTASSSILPTTYSGFNSTSSSCE